MLAYMQALLLLSVVLKPTFAIQTTKRTLDQEVVHFQGGGKGLPPGVTPDMLKDFQGGGKDLPHGVTPEDLQRFCEVVEETSVSSFDGAQISLTATGVSNDSGVRWFIKNRDLAIQARLTSDQKLEAIAIGGRWFMGQILMIGSLSAGLTWNGRPFKGNQTSNYQLSWNDDSVTLVAAPRPPVSKEPTFSGSSPFSSDTDPSPVVTINFPRGIELLVKRLPDHILVAVGMGRLDDGQEGICGNNNGNKEDDEVTLDRLKAAVSVPREDSLFNVPFEESFLSGLGFDTLFEWAPEEVIKKEVAKKMDDIGWKGFR